MAKKVVSKAPKRAPKYSQRLKPRATLTKALRAVPKKVKK